AFRGERGLRHRRDDVRLTDGLPVPNREWPVGVGFGATRLRNETVPRDLAHRSEYASILDAFGFEGVLHQTRALRRSFLKGWVLARRGRGRLGWSGGHGGCGFAGVQLGVGTLLLGAFDPKQRYREDQSGLKPF